MRRHVSGEISPSLVVVGENGDGLALLEAQVMFQEAPGPLVLAEIR